MEKNHKFTVTFIGTDMDVAKVVRDLHISFNNTLAHDNTAAGISKAYASMASATTCYMSDVANTGVSNTSNFFAKKRVLNTENETTTE